MIGLLGLGSATLDYTAAVKGKEKLAKMVNSQPEVKAGTDYYQANIGNVKNVDDLLKDRKLLTVALGAYGLESQVGAKGLLKKLLSEDPTASGSLAQRMADPRYQNFAKAFASLRSDGGASIRQQASIDSVVGAYRQSQFEKAVGRNDTSARQALYFARVAPQATQSIYQVLTDKTLSAVVREAYGLPKEAAALDVKQQIRQLESKGFDHTKLGDEKFVKSLIGKFLASKDAAGAPAGADEDAVQSTSALAAASMLSSALSIGSSNGVTGLDLSFLGNSRRVNLLA